MPNIDNWGGDTQPVRSTDRAHDAWRRIQDKPTSITIVRSGTVLPQQIVRIEVGGGNEVSGAAGSSSQRTVTIFGLRQHPYLTDSDIKRDDRFAWGGNQYHVIDVIEFPGDLQATAIRQG